MTRALIVDKCNGCSKVVQEPWKETGAILNLCSVYPNPSVFWTRGGCFFNTKVAVKTTHKRVGQQKQAKR